MWTSASSFTWLETVLLPISAETYNFEFLGEINLESVFLIYKKKKKKKKKIAIEFWIFELVFSLQQTILIFWNNFLEKKDTSSQK